MAAGITVYTPTAAGFFAHQRSGENLVRAYTGAQTAASSGGGGGGGSTGRATATVTVGVRVGV